MFKILFSNLIILFIKRYFTFLFALLVLSACRKPEIPSPPVPPISPYPLLLWQQNNNMGASIKPIINSKGDVLFSDYFNNPQGQVFYLRDGKTGEVKWQWSDYFSPETSLLTFNKTYNDILVLEGFRACYAINLITGKTIWKNQIHDTLLCSFNLYFDNEGFVYRGFTSKLNKHTVYIYRAKCSDGIWEKVCQYTDTSLDYSRFEVSSIGISKNTANDKIVAFTIYCLKNGSQYPNPPKVLIVGFNITKNQFDWQHDYKNEFGEFSVFMFSNNNGLLYSFVQGNRFQVIAFSAQTGNIVWKTNLRSDKRSLYFYKDKLIITYSGSEAGVLAVNQMSGAVVWEKRFPFLTRGFDFMKDDFYKHYFISEQNKNILIINADNGSIAFDEDLSIAGRSFTNTGLSVDENAKVFFLSNDAQSLAFKLPASIAMH